MGIVWEHTVGHTGAVLGEVLFSPWVESCWSLSSGWKEKTLELLPWLHPIVAEIQILITQPDLLPTRTMVYKLNSDESTFLLS